MQLDAVLPESPMLAQVSEQQVCELKPVTRLAIQLTAPAEFTHDLNMHLYTDGSFTPASDQHGARCSWAFVVLGEAPRNKF
eukprot:10172746-Alexandrium_andersonii.AAC.1